MDMPALFSLASQKNRWLAQRQAALAENIANANTPGYRARDAEPFDKALAQPAMQFAATHPAHLRLQEAACITAIVNETAGTNATHSGNNVNLEQEMMKIGDVNRAYSLNIGVLKSFQRMMLAGTRG